MGSPALSGPRDTSHYPTSQCPSTMSHGGAVPEITAPLPHHEARCLPACLAHWEGCGAVIAHVSPPIQNYNSRSAKITLGPDQVLAMGTGGAYFIINLVASAPTDNKFMYRKKSLRPGLWGGIGFCNLTRIVYPFDWSVGFKFSPQLGLAGVIVLKHT